ncbi:phosphate transporter, partial [Serratia sp. Ag1]
SVIGSGLGRRGSSVRWRTVGRIALGWLFTLPSAAIVGALAALLAQGLGTTGVIIDAVLGLLFILFIFWRSSRNKVDHSNAINVPDVAESGYAVRIRKRGKVKPVPTETGTIPPLTPIAKSAVRSDHAARAAEQAADDAERQIRAVERAAIRTNERAARAAGDEENDK